MSNHTFRATGITAYLKNGGVLENAAAMANHASTRTTQLYDRRRIAGYRCGCARRAASAMKCRATTILKPICTPISTAAGLVPIRAAVSHHRPHDRAAYHHAPPASQCPRHDPPARRRRRHHDPGRQSHLSGDRHHGVSEKRRHAGKRCRDGEPRLNPHHAVYDRRCNEVNLGEVERISI
jgi:hypothetical protein